VCKAHVRSVDTHELGEAPPDSVVPYRVDDVAIGVPEHPVRTDSRVAITRGLGQLPRNEPARPLEAMDRDLSRQQRCGHRLAAAAAVPLAPLGEHTIGAEHAGDYVGDRNADLRRLAGTRTGRAHQAAISLQDLVVASAQCFGSLGTEAVDRQRHELRVDPLKHHWTEAESLHHAGEHAREVDDK
jgi:hypothetical protein